MASLINVILCEGNYRFDDRALTCGNFSREMAPKSLRINESNFAVDVRPAATA